MYVEPESEGAGREALTGMAGDAAPLGKTAWGAGSVGQRGSANKQELDSDTCSPRHIELTMLLHFLL